MRCAMVCEIDVVSCSALAQPWIVKTSTESNLQLPSFSELPTACKISCTDSSAERDDVRCPSFRRYAGLAWTNETRVRSFSAILYRIKLESSTETLASGLHRLAASMGLPAPARRYDVCEISL